MTQAEVKKRFYGFTYWHNRMVKDQYKRKKKTLWEVYSNELMNTGTVELPSYQTKSGHPETWW